MTLMLRNGIWHWKKMVNGELYARTTRTGDKRIADQIAAIWEGELIQQVLVMGIEAGATHDEAVVQIAQTNEVPVEAVAKEAA